MGRTSTLSQCTCGQCWDGLLLKDFALTHQWKMSKMSPPPGRMGTRSKGAGKNLLWWRSPVDTRWKLSKMPPPSGRRDKRPPPPPGRRGTRSSGARKYYTAVVEAARARIIVASEDFAPFAFLISGRAMSRLSCHCRRIYRYKCMRICIFHKLFVCGDASGSVSPRE